MVMDIRKFSFFLQHNETCIQNIVLKYGGWIFVTVAILPQAVSVSHIERPVRLHPSTLLMLVLSKKQNIDTAALVTIAQCNTLVARCSRQLIGPAAWVFVTLAPLRCD